jgi:hypothetical protein
LLLKRSNINERVSAAGMAVGWIGCPFFLIPESIFQKMWSRHVDIISPGINFPPSYPANLHGPMTLGSGSVPR